MKGIGKLEHPNRVRDLSLDEYTIIAEGPAGMDVELRAIQQLGAGARLRKRPTILESLTARSRVFVAKDAHA